MENHVNSPLPPHIMVEIFLLLPLDSILTCKAVSKEWKNLIEDPEFIELYDFNVESTTTFFLRGNSLNCLFRRDNNNSYKVGRIPMKLNRYPNDYLRQHELLVESSNTIACVKSSDGRFLLYNLFTGDLRVVADAPVRQDYWLYWLCYGFAYDRDEDDYKIVVVWKSTFRASIHVYEGTRFDLPGTVNEDDTKRSMVFVYSYRNRGWKMFEGFPHDEYNWPTYNATGYYFNGLLHWVVTRIGTPSMRVVAALDLHSYGLAEFVLPPPCYNDDWIHYTNLSELDGSLCCSLLDRDTVDVWVMKEYGVAESWTKLFSLYNCQISRLSWYEKTYTTTTLYRCRDGGKIVVFLQHKSKLETLFRYDIDEGHI